MSQDSKFNNNNGNNEQSSIYTQTNWSWLGDVRTMELLKRDFYSNDEFEELKSVSTINGNDDDDANSDSAVTINQTPREPETPLLESVGPPKILRYKSESRVISNISELITPDTSDVELQATDEDLSFGSILKAMNINIFGGTRCEFCMHTVKPWPTIEYQEYEKPENLYCCNDYREFVEAMIEIEKQKQIASESHLLEFIDSRSGFTKKNEGLVRQVKQRLQKRFGDQAKNGDSQSSSETSASSEQCLSKTNSIDSFVPLVITKQTSNAKQEVTSRTASSTHSSLFSKQLKSINYQLSNLRYMQQGWTVRPECYFDFDEIEEDDPEEKEENIFLSENSIDSFKTFEKPLITKYYKSGDIFLLIFPDGTGNVYYPSGRLAILISLVSLGMHILTIYDDEETEPAVLAVFDPYGHVCCNYPDGKLKIQMSPIGGVELDTYGNRKKRWLWWDSTEHVHVPPYQPFIFMLNKYLSVKIHTQKKIYLSFFADAQACKFRVGTKISVLKPECIPSGFKQDPHDVYLKKKKSEIDELLKLIKERHNKKFVPLPNSSSSTPKLPKINSKVGKMQKETTNMVAKSTEPTPAINRNNSSRNFYTPKKYDTKFLIVN